MQGQHSTSLQKRTPDLSCKAAADTAMAPGTSGAGSWSPKTRQYPHAGKTSSQPEQGSILAGRGAFQRQKAQDQIPSPGEGVPAVSIRRGTVKHCSGISSHSLSCFNQSTLERQIAGPEVLYLYLFSLNLQLTFFHENMPHSSLYEFNSPSSVIFCLKQATQLFTTFIEAGATCSDSPKTRNCSSGFSHVQTPNCRDGTSRATAAGGLSPTPPPPRAPWDPLPDSPRLPAAKGLPELLSSCSHALLRTGTTRHPERPFRC